MVQTTVRRFAAILAVLVLTLAAVSGTGTVQAESVTIRITDALDPAAVTVAPGASITFVNADGERHRMRTTTGPDEFDTGNLEPGQRFTLTLTAVGTYRYLDERDDDNPAYVGQIVVSSTPATTAPGGPPATAAPPPTTVTVSIGDRLYAPATVTVAPGGTVTWVNNDDRPHTVTADDRSFDSGIMNAGGRWSRVFPNGGTFTYFCELHPDMRGSVVVGAGGGAPAPTAPTTAPPAPTPAPTTPPPTTPGATAPSTGAVSISGNRFTPATITIVAGGSVTWTNRDAVPHTVTASDRSFDSGILRQGDTWTRTFPSAGTFAYFCELHPEMRATVVVVPPGTPAPPPTNPPPVTGPTSPPPTTSAPSGTPPPTVPPGQPLPAAADVAIVGNAYQPQVVTIAVGGSVTWRNSDEVPHTVTATDRSFDSGILLTGGTWTKSFPSAGTYIYFCELHPEMTATVIVTTAGASPPPVVTGGSSTNSSTAGTHGTVPASGIQSGSPGATEAGSTGAESGTGDAPRVASVSMAANQFQPTTVTVGVGGEVTWTNTDTIPHTVTADDGSFDSGIMMPGDTFTWRFDQAGSMPYRCILHPGMIGTVDVVAGSAAAPRTSGVAPSPAATSGESVAGDGSAPSSSGTATDEIIVRVTDGEFPAVVTAAVGQTVTWVNDHDRPIDIVADDGSFSSGEIAPGDRFSRSFLAEGARSYRSTLRDRTEGMLVVLPDAADAAEVVPTVAVYDAWFAPRDLVVHQGATVRWAFGGVLPHTVTLVDGSFDSGVLQPGATFEFTFDALGTFDYSCIVHPSMTGTVTVVPPGEEIPESQSGVSALDGGGGESAAALDGSRTGADRTGSTGIPLGAVPLLILGLGFGAALGILFGVGRSAPGRATAS